MIFAGIIEFKYSQFDFIKCLDRFHHIFYFRYDKTKVSCLNNGQNNEKLAEYQEIDISHIYGVFVLLLFAAGISIFVLFIEWMIALWQSIDQTNPNVCKLIGNTFNGYVCCNSSN